MFCDIGSHLIASNENEYRCAHCGRRLCMMHMGNPDVLPGEHIACSDHVEEVAAMEAKLKASRMRKQQRHPSTIMIGSIVHYAYNPSLLGLKGTHVCVPAIVTRIFHKGVGDINLREFETMDMKCCLYAEEMEPGTWHWLEDHHAENK